MEVYQWLLRHIMQDELIAIIKRYGFLCVLKDQNYYTDKTFKRYKKYRSKLLHLPHKDIAPPVSHIFYSKKQKILLGINIIGGFELVLRASLLSKLTYEAKTPFVYSRLVDKFRLISNMQIIINPGSRLLVFIGENIHIGSNKLYKVQLEFGIALFINSIVKAIAHPDFKKYIHLIKSIDPEDCRDMCVTPFNINDLDFFE